MALNLREAFTPQVIAAYWTEAVSNRYDYIGPALFPARKKAGLDLSWLKGSRGIPISLMPSAFDAKATFRDRIGFGKLETEMPFFREGYKIKERDRQELMRIMDSKDPYAQQIIDRIFDDVADLISAAQVVPERMIMQLLFPEDGKAGISIQANGMDYTYEYDKGSKWKENNYIVLTSNDTWDKPDTADPIQNFIAANNKIRSLTGTELATAIMNSNTFNMMAKAKAIKDRFLTTSGRAFGYLTDNEVRSIVEGTTNIRILVYDKQYRDEDKVAHSFVPDGYVALIPSGPLGSTWYGTTPEEADLQGSSTAEVSIVNTGVAITRIIEEHPVNVNTYASEIVLPSFERMDEVAVLRVTAGE